VRFTTTSRLVTVSEQTLSSAIEIFSMAFFTGCSEVLLVSRDLLLGTAACWSVVFGDEKVTEDRLTCCTFGTGIPPVFGMTLTGFGSTVSSWQTLHILAEA